MVAFQALDSDQVLSWLLLGRLSFHVPRYFFVWLWKYSSVKNLERELSFKSLKSDSFDVRGKKKTLDWRKKLNLIWKIQLCFIWTCFNILLKDWPVSCCMSQLVPRLFWTTLDSSWLTYESFEMQGNCQSFRLIDHLVFLRIYPKRPLSVWSVGSV